ncbi:MAG: hypothetical protein JNN15_02435, partial [Blastocatellia bacterium]|nr:hypothetical protein [Blastocatellia bacterium]
MQVKTFMSGISYILGELRDITEIDELRGNEEVLANLQASGVKQYAHAVESLIAMTERSAAETITKSGIKPEEVDVVVIATNAYRAAPLMLDEYKIMFYNLGLTKAYPIGVFLSNCGNLHSALRVATSIIKAEGKKHVLVITSDRVLEDESRIYPPGIAVISDGVASCMISSEADREYEILHIEQHIDNFLSQVDARTNLQQFFKLFADGVTYAISHAISHVGKNIKDFKMLITNN